MSPSVASWMCMCHIIIQSDQGNLVWPLTMHDLPSSIAKEDVHAITVSPII